MTENEKDVLIKDLTRKNARLEEAAKEAQKSNEAKSLYLVSMSHEIRTPMNSIIGMTALARRSTNLTEIHTFLDKVDHSSHQLLDLISDIMDMSQIEVGIMQLESLPFNLESAIDNCIKIAAAGAVKKHQEFHTNISRHFPRYLIGDRFRFSQILLKLLANAVKYTPEEGEINFEILDIAIDADHSTLFGKISDNGIGIPEEFRKIIFAPFDAPGRNRREHSGFGLGLPICKNLITLMGGELRVDSAPGKGSTFTFELPVTWGDKIPDASTPLAETTPQPIVENYNWSDKCILLAEDNELNREIVEHMFWDSGVKLVSAENGQAAFELFRKNPTNFDLILMDVQMPVLDGIAATKQIRSSGLEGSAQIPIIACTAHVFQEELTECLASGMNGYIMKPYNFQEVMLTLNSYLNGKLQKGEQ
jgi:CheY-like chemotaxis protein/nitrogen-specific signal transduction histidine kinase